MEEIHEDELEDNGINIDECYPHVEIMSDFNVGSITVVKARKAVCTSDEYFKLIEDNTTYYKPSAYKRLKVYFEEPDILLPKFETLRILRQTRNPKWVECLYEGKKVPVLIPKKFNNQLTKGKQIRVEVVTNVDGKKSFRHERLAR